MSPNKRLKGKAQKKKPSIKNLSETKPDNIFDEYIVFTFKELDINQKQGTSTFEHWNTHKDLLLQLLNKIKDLSTMKFANAISVSQSGSPPIDIYGDFPKKSDYKHPKHVTPDANWARLHIQGKIIVAGHIVNNVFSIVFLDIDHRFYITEKKHT